MNNYDLEHKNRVRHASHIYHLYSRLDRLKKKRDGRDNLNNHYEKQMFINYAYNIWKGNVV